MFALIWSNTALDQLADAYVAADPVEREQMAAGIESLNTRLRDDPLAVGESRVGAYRVEFVPRFAVLFHVSEADRIVRVVRLRPSRR
jgi:plasmid stabilization system protein ParE